MISYHGEFLTDTRGTGIINRLFHSYAPFKGSVEGRRNGVLLAMDIGEATEYDLPVNVLHCGCLGGLDGRFNLY